MRIKCFQIFFIFLLLLFDLVAKGGTITENVDSLKRLLETVKEDTQKVNILNRIAFALSSNSPDSAMQFAQQALHLAEKTGFKSGIADSYFSLALIYKVLDNYSHALSFYFKSLRIYESLKDKNDMASSYNNIASIYSAQGNYSQALDFYFKSLKIRESIEDIKGAASSYNNIAGIYYAQGNYSQALDFYFKSLKISESLEDKNGIAASYNNIANIYYEKANYSKTLDFHFKSLNIFESMEDKKGMANSYNNIANVYHAQGNYPKALDYNLKSFKIREFIEDKQGMAFSYSNIAGIYYEQGNYSQALDFCLKSLIIAEFINAKSSMASSCNNIASIYHKQGNYSKSLDYYFKSLIINESLKDKKGIIASYFNIGELFIVLGSDTVYSQSIAQKADSLISQYLPENLSSFKAMIPPGRNGLYHHALQFLLKSINMAEEMDAKEILTYALPSIGKLYVKINKTSEAIPYYIRSIEIAKEIGSTPSLSYSYQGVSEAWFQLSNQTKNPSKKAEYLNKAFSALQDHVSLKDTLFNEQSIRSINEMQTKYETEKKEKEIEIQGLKISQQESEITNQQLIKNFSIGFLLLITVIAFVLYNRYRFKQKANNKLMELNANIQEQNKKLDIAYTQLKNLESFKESMTGMIVHDLKNPLNTILGFSNGLPSARSNRLINDSGRQMLRLVENILDVQKFEDAKIQLDIRKHVLYLLADEAIEEVELPANQKNIQIKTIIDKNLVGEFDKEIITRVLVNLLSNSIKYTQPGGKITIASQIINQKSEDWIKVSVSDTGVGIPQEQINKVFEKFYQAEARKLGVARSTGLGLTFCKLAVEAHKGTISVESEINKGTTFSFTLLLSEKPISDEIITKSEVKEKPVSHHVLIPFSEKEKEILKKVVQELMGLNVYLASDIMSVLKKIEDTDSKNLNQWSDAIKDAMLNGDEPRYEELLKKYISI